MNYSISEKAQNDLENIWYYTFFEWSEEQANKYYRQIILEINNLCNNPKSGKDFSHIKKDYWKAKAQSHFIFYKINKEKNEIEIIRILHHQMDINSRLND